MKRHKPIVVPGNCRYISDWKDYNFSLTPGKCIIDKKVPGCGFTEFYLRNSENVILASPRVMLLQNKWKQHFEENEGKEFIFMLNNNLISEQDPNVDKDMSRDRKIQNKTSLVTSKKKVIAEKTDEEKRKEETTVFESVKEDICNYLQRMRDEGRPYKILVTYDSYHLVKKILKFEGIFTTFTTMVDEFQTLLQDAAFKANTEQSFMEQLSDVYKVHFVSATPMLDKYLERLNEFKDLDYYSIDWETENPSRFIKPGLEIKTMKSVTVALGPIIDSYKKGEFDYVYRRDENGNIVKFEAKEAVFYVNSVSHIIATIKKYELKPEEVNILCANTEDNQNRIRTKLGKTYSIGSIPLKGKKSKMFTFCTRTVYLGADFYSECAKSYIFGDSNSNCLVIDISQDLPQILGRQRLKSNPWKNSATFYYRATADWKKMSKEDFEALVEKKLQKTNNLIKISMETNDEAAKLDLMDTYQDAAKTSGYKTSYLSVNGYGKERYATINKYVLVSEQRAFDIQQIDYKDRFSVVSEVTKTYDSEINLEVRNTLEKYTGLTQISDRIKLIGDLWTTHKNQELQDAFLAQLPDSDLAKSYYLTLGYDKCKALCYNVTSIRKFINVKTFEFSDINDQIYKVFKEGERYTKAFIKDTLKQIYEDVKYKGAAKASDLEKWFEIKSCLITENGKRVNAFEIIKKK